VLSGGKKETKKRDPSHWGDSASKKITMARFYKKKQLGLQITGVSERGLLLNEGD